MGLPHHSLSPEIGCAVDFDLQREPTAEELQELRTLHARHHLLMFRAQKLSMARQAEVADWFAPVLRTRDGLTYISNVPGLGVLGDHDLGFHSDLSYAEYPYRSLSLHAVDVVDGATTTRFATSVAAYRRLPERLKRRIEGLRVLHVSAGGRMSGRPEQRAYDDDTPHFVRPLVMHHPASGEPILYVMENQTVRVLDMPDDESEALLQELFGFLYAPENLFEHRWYRGDILIWDNLALQHARSNIKGRGNRTLQRTAAGEKGLFVQYPKLEGVYDNSAAPPS